MTKELLTSLSLVALLGFFPKTAEAAPQNPAVSAPGVLAEAGRALEQGDLPQAELGFRAAAQANPESPLPWLGLAEVSERRGALPRALRFVRQATERAPSKIEPYLLASRLFVRLGAPAEALGALKKARQLAPRDYRAYLFSALILRDVERLEEAIDLLESARAAGLENPEMTEQLGLLYLASGAPAKAQAVAEEALEQHPEHPGITLVEGLALAGQPERRSEALGWLETALRRGAPDPGRIHLEIATLLLEIERPEEALNHLAEAQEALPESPKALYRLGNALRAAGNLKGASAALERFRELSQAQEQADRQRKEIGTALNEVQQLATQNQLSQALERLAVLRVDQPQEPQVPVLEAKIRFSMGQNEAALEALRESRKLAPNDVEIPYLEGFFLYSMNRPFKAAQALQSALTLNPRLGEAHALLGVLAMGWDDPAEAIDHFRQALEGGMDSADLRLAYARALKSLGHTAESAVQFEAWQRFSGQ
jgi:tetratricopeptide (TPR) repeat protein